MGCYSSGCVRYKYLTKINNYGECDLGTKTIIILNIYTALDFKISGTS